MRVLLSVASAAALIAVPAAAMQHDGHAGHAAAKSGDAIAAAVAAPTRTPANVARDTYRHPAETLAFFGVKPGDTVVELWPGGGWYTEILAPLSKAGGGTLYAAAPWERGLNRIKEWQGAKPDV
jgi:predicted methyltransferase